MQEKGGSGAAVESFFTFPSMTIGILNFTFYFAYVFFRVCGTEIYKKVKIWIDKEFFII